MALSCKSLIAVEVPSGATSVIRYSQNAVQILQGTPETGNCRMLEKQQNCYPRAYDLVPEGVQGVAEEYNCYQRACGLVQAATGW
jgi:hypothetical protein